MSAMLVAAEPPAIDPRSPITLLPEGSVLKKVLLPRYNAQRSLVGDLQAKTLTLISKNNVEGKDVVIRFFEEDRSLKAEIEMARVIFNQKTSILTAEKPVTLKGPQLYAAGSGLAYRFTNGEGFLRGPVTTKLTPSEATSMNTKIIAPAVLSSIAASSLIFADRPADITAEELQEIQQLASPQGETLQIKTTTSDSALKQEIEAGNNASEAAESFIADTKLEIKATKSSPAPPAAAPLEIEKDPQTTIIECADGMYFDADEGVLVYIGNVQVKDPRFDLTGADQVKIFFSKPAAEKAKEKPDKSIAGNFGDVQRLLATGAVKILQKSVDGKAPVEASGAVLSYNIPKNEMIISDGFPWVRQGKFYARAKEANLSLRLSNDGSFTTRGNWEMGGQLNLQGE